MRAVEIDLLQGQRRSGNGVVLLALGVAAAFAAVSLHDDLRSEADLLESRAAKLERLARGVPAVELQVDESARQEIARANAIIDQLALPWDRLLRAVENAASDRVVLRGIAPDAKTGTVQIGAETADSEAMFDYVRKLERQDGLSNVYLLQHRRERGNAARPIRFLVSASWLPRPR